MLTSGSLSENSLSSDSQSPLRTCFLAALLLGEYLDVLGGHTNSYRNILSPFSCISDLTLPRQPYILVSSSLNGHECWRNKLFDLMQLLMEENRISPIKLHFSPISQFMLEKIAFTEAFKLLYSCTNEFFSLTCIMKGISLNSGFSFKKLNHGLLDLSTGWVKKSSLRYWPTRSKLLWWWGFFESELVSCSSDFSGAKLSRNSAIKQISCCDTLHSSSETTKYIWDLNWLVVQKTRG